MKCPNCNWKVPVVSEYLASQIGEKVKRLPQARQAAIHVATFSWLVEKHEGLSTYLGINGRDYTNEEKDLIGAESAACAATPCPYWDHHAKSCLLGGLGPKYTRVSETARAPYGWLPTMLARLIDKTLLRLMVQSKQIADVKIALLTRNDAFYSASDAGTRPPAMVR